MRYIGATPAAEWAGGYGQYVGATPAAEWAGGYAGNPPDDSRVRHMRSYWRGATPYYDWRGGMAGGLGQGETVPPPPAEPPPPPPAAGPLDKVTSWWAAQSTTTKVAIGLGGASVVGLVLWALMGGSKKAMTPNRRRRRRRYKANRRQRRKLTAKQRASLGRIRGKRGRAKTGKITTLKSGKRYGHLKPPKRYWKMGAKRAGDYADPSHYKYPLVFRTPSGAVNVKRTKSHIRAAQSYFARNKKKYPTTTRRTIARNINKAKKRFGIGGKVVKP